MKKRTILDEAQISRSLTRMSHEILERNKGTEGLVFLGVRTRGEFLADRLQQKVEEIDGVTIPTGTIDITAYRDDKVTDTEALEEAIDIDIPLDDRHVIIVDDVLYTGRTIRAAMDAILNHVRPSKISLAVLIDRGHRELPIRADYVGKNIPTAREEKINVYLEEHDNANEVVISE
ncbi:bifunctional pyr operon transcriptional regulator/uracil phosphoribosyltransferase PyrR [Salinicoccus halodurans]|uniref:Bifunctional protein PyrR n=1 Tax=Salinicoccus halodurans TaxID=407035 RepID=A0A0F7HKP5_9STAP|nr:bifunctional pyr operon transcriptional regulator/uracil phosphoribosyltransferase PyrR [Salinicoccus halodurans]AKG73717.1 phosphoribosyl transferase [Salinicoccus halodurans]SFK54750.1 pyrimidine operon attenuation protein / uracil phosphoribosyltransferase [Salinicoccus halodurans]